MNPKPSPISPQSRRSVLKFGLAGAVAAASSPFGDSRALADEMACESADYGGLVVGLQSYTLRALSLQQTLAAMRNDLKVHAVEFVPHHLAGTSPARIRDLLLAHDVQALSYGVVPFTNDQEANRKWFELAKTFGMKNLSCDPDPDSLESIDRLAEEYDITVAIHPHGPGHRWGETTQLEAAFAGRSRRVGLCADTGHMIRSGRDPLQVMAQFEDRLHALHLKDFRPQHGGRKWEDVPAGSAGLDVDGVIKFLISSKSRAAVFIEYEGANPISSAQRSIDRVKQAVRKAQGCERIATTRGTRPAARGAATSI